MLGQRRYWISRIFRVFDSILSNLKALLHADLEKSSRSWLSRYAHAVCVPFVEESGGPKLSAVRW